MKTLREQMNDAMILRGFATRTQESYLAAVRALAKYYHRSPDLLTTEEIEAYHLPLIIERKLAYASVNQSASACRFLFDKVLKRPRARFDIPMAKVPKTLPRVLSRDEVSRLFAAAPNPRARTLLMTTFATGLRVSELCALQLSDIESAPDRMCTKVRQGKGGKDRYTMLPPQLLQTLRDYWVVMSSAAIIAAWCAIGTIPVATGTVRSARHAPKKHGSLPGDKKCCRCRTSI